MELKAFVEALDEDKIDTGVKGMKWGVRKDNGHEGESAKTKKIDKLDTKFAKSADSVHTFIKVNNSAAEKANAIDLPRINGKKEYANADFTKPSPLRTKYYKEHEDAFIKRLDEAADSMGTNASGTKKYTIAVDDNGNWHVVLADITHADGGLVVTITYNASGHITHIGEATEEPVVHIETAADFLAHVGVKGMRWGVRKDRNAARSARRAAKKAPQDSVVKAKPGRRVSVKGGKRQPATEDAIAASISRRKVRVNSTDQLSTPELKKLVERMQLESNYKRLAKDDPNIAEILLQEMDRAVAGK